MSDTIPVAQLRAFVERIERIEADIKDLNGDKSEVYKELRGCGFDVKAVRAVVAKRKLDTADREERDAMFELYWSALNGTGTEHATRVHVHEASYSEAKGRGDAVGKTDAISFDPETGELTDNQKSEPCLGHATEHSAYVGTAPDENPAQDDVGATASSTNSAHKPAGDLAADNGDKDRGSFPVGGPVHSHSPAAIPLGAANSAGGAPSSSPASPARHSDDIDLTIPAFLRRDEGRGYPKREAVEA